MLVTTIPEYRDLLLGLLDLRGDEYVAIDCETTGLNLYRDDVIRGVSLAFRDRAWYVSLSHPASVNMPAQPLREALERCMATPIYHNAPFDMAALERGIDLTPEFGANARYDTAVLAWLCNENGRHGLKPLAARIWPEIDPDAEQRHLKALFKGSTQAEVYKRMRQELADAGTKEPASVTKERAKAEVAGSKKDWGTVTAEDIGAYAAQDAALTLRLFHWLRDQAEYRRVEPAVDREHAVQEAVYRMIRLGVQVDVTRIEQTRAEYLCRMDEIVAEFAPVNLGSPKQLADLIYVEWGLPVLERTKTGAPSTSKDALDLLAGQHPGLDRILEYRKLQKAVRTYFDALLACADENGRVHASLNPIGTATGRFSCSAPNLQNIPRSGTNSDVTDVFIAADGYELYSFDMSQAELRIAASLAQEPAMLDRFESGEDIYMGTAETLNIERQAAKVVVLASGYGIGARKLARGLKKGTGEQPTECAFWVLPADERRGVSRCHDCDACDAKAILDGYWGSVPELRAMNRRLIDFAEANRYVPLHLPGRFRRYPTPQECIEQRLIDWPKPYTAMNSVVQGGCAELVKSWILASEPRLAKLDARLVLTVHDSLVVELRPGTLEAVQRALQGALDQVTPKGWMTIPIEPKAGV